MIQGRVLERLMTRTMIPFEVALAQVLERAQRLPIERVELAQCLGRVLAQDVATDMDFPPFDKACMDGFACRKEDLSSWLNIVETIPAGVVPTQPIRPGQAARIMTGAMVPEGADMVFMVEYSEVVGERVRFTAQETMPNIAWRGEDLSTGDLVLPAGTRLEARHLAVLASVGTSCPQVYARPRIGVIATGDELVEPGMVPAMGQIRNSNSGQLMAQASRAGGLATYYGIARDEEAAIESVLLRALAENEVVLLSGGVSMGDFDLVPAVMKRCGVSIQFDQVAVKPGKPVTFGTTDRAVVFGMPGNPVSTYVIFEIFVRPYLRACMGEETVAPEVVVQLASPIHRRRTERLEFLPVAINDAGKVMPVRYHGSAHFFGLSVAHGLVRMPVGVARLEAGTEVRIVVL